MQDERKTYVLYKEEIIMYMKMLERILLRYLVNNKVKMEITGFDMKEFSEAMHLELKELLETIESIILEDAPDSNKVTSIKILFERENYL